MDQQSFLVKYVFNKEDYSYKREVEKECFHIGYEDELDFELKIEGDQQN